MHTTVGVSAQWMNHDTSSNCYYCWSCESSGGFQHQNTHFWGTSRLSFQILTDGFTGAVSLHTGHTRRFDSERCLWSSCCCCSVWWTVLRLPCSPWCVVPHAVLLLLLLRNGLLLLGFPSSPLWTERYIYTVSYLHGMMHTHKNSQTQGTYLCS